MQSLTEYVTLAIQSRLFSKQSNTKVHMHNTTVIIWKQAIGCLAYPITVEACRSVRCFRHNQQT